MTGGIEADDGAAGVGLLPAAIWRDPQIDRLYPALTTAHAIASAGVNLNAVLYNAAGRGPHPTILLLHGLPGNEQNIDLAQSMRRAGWNVLTLHYRGSWGTPGTFSFEHCLQDAVAAADWLMDPKTCAALRIDPDRLVVIGHSMGGYIAAHLGSVRLGICGIALISPANIGPAFGQLPRPDAIAAVDDNVGASDGLHILAGTSPEALAKEAHEKRDDLQLERYGPALNGRPVLLITSDDGFSTGSAPFAAALATGAALTAVHLATDHSYSDHRIRLQLAILGWLAALPL